MSRVSGLVFERLGGYLQQVMSFERHYKLSRGLIKVTIITNRELGVDVYCLTTRNRSTEARAKEFVDDKPLYYPPRIQLIGDI